VQVKKPEVRARIVEAALEVFAERGFTAATMPEIGVRAGVAPANVYRYFEGKEALFDAALPPALAAEHGRLLDASARSLASLARVAPTGTTEANEELLRFWLAHRSAVVVLLDRAEGTRYAGYGARFVRRLVALLVAELGVAEPRAPVTASSRRVLAAIFDGTRRAIVSILAARSSEREAREAIAAFRSYQMAGLAGFAGWIRRG
jgi:AcrR family transcriptional regulator